MTTMMVRKQEKLFWSDYWISHLIDDEEDDAVATGNQAPGASSSSDDDGKMNFWNDGSHD